jgi:hypothetical protein
LFGNNNPHPGQFGDDVAPRALAVVGQKRKRNLLGEQPIDEAIRTRNKLLPAIDHAVHVNQKTFARTDSHGITP